MKMTIIAIFLLCLAIKATFAEKCPKPATCPCGSNGYNITVCAQGTALGEFCSRFSKCEACEDGKDFCTKCPGSLSGPTCSRELKKIRQKRHTLHRYIRRRDTLSAGYCDLFVQKAGNGNCTVDSSRTWCDIRCGTRHMGRFTCYPGRAWEPSLPLCITMNAKFHGEHCYNPGPILNGKVQYFAPGKTKPGENLDYEVEWFRGGSVVQYSCDKDLIIKGSPRMTCEKTGKWSTAKPTCGSACSALDGPYFGTKKCSSNTCTGKCFAGYHFEDSVSQDEMTLSCRGGVWTPRTSFPKCKSAGYCDLFYQKAGKHNCTVDQSRTWCDIRCGTRHMGRFTCYPGRAWEPTLPLCITMNAKFHGEHCYNPGPIQNGKVQYFAPGKTKRGENLDYEVEWLRGGSVVEYSCDKDLIIQGSPRLTCEKTGKWSTAKPTCGSGS